MKEFTILNNYRSQQEERLAKRKEHHDKIKAAEQVASDLERQLDEVRTIEITQNVDKSEEKAALRSRIEQARKELEYVREDELAKIAHLNRQEQEIKAIDVVRAYINDYAPAVKAELLPELSAKLEAVKQAYYEALLELYKTIDEYEPLAQEVEELNNAALNRGETNAYRTIDPPIRESDVIGNMISERDIDYIRKNLELPKNQNNK